MAPVHDLRPGAATLAPATGIEVKVVSEMLGHSSTTTITRDTSTSVFETLCPAAIPRESYRDRPPAGDS